ncbi:MAG TPA: hypothetical protein DGX96_07160 [Lachnospiraceae bacterium]|jgi:hypothetical protein|nr:hypothetical protein [Lachnospiraceae bacterium]
MPARISEKGGVTALEDVVKVTLLQENEAAASTDIKESLFHLDQQIEDLTSKADRFDYFLAMASGLACGMLDAVGVGEFDLKQGRDAAAEQVKNFVKKAAHLKGCDSDDLTACVKYLEEIAPIPEDGNTPDFGGGLNHHLRDFGHHPSIVGLICSIATQFTGFSFGTDVSGNFIIVPVPEKSREYLGTDIPDKIFRGTVTWFFHLVSDVAGSSSTAALSGGTGIPGPIVSLVKECSVLPVFRNMNLQEQISPLISKLFNGTLFAKKDANNHIIRDTVVRFDLRGELGAALELGRQAMPVVLNEVIVRTFYFIRHLVEQIRNSTARSLADLCSLDFSACKPYGNPTIDRMLTIATGVFSSMDIAGAVATKSYFVSVNYVGLGRFTLALGRETVNFLRVRDVRKIRDMYETIRRNTFTETDNRMYGRMEEKVDISKFGLTEEQTEILYNLEFYKTLDCIASSMKMPVTNRHILSLKNEWVAEWRAYMDKGFQGFVNREGAVLHWYTKEDLKKKIAQDSPEKTWFRLVLLEAMVFEPYFALSLEKDRKGNETPSRKYQELQNPVLGYQKADGDRFLENFFQQEPYYQKGYVKRLRSCYDKNLTKLNEVQKNVTRGIIITAGVTVAAVLTAGMFAPAIAVALVGSNFSGLTGAALTSACLAYLGGGAIAAGGFGMAGGTMAIVGGGALLGLGAGAGAAGISGAAALMGKKQTILQSAKLMVSVQEIFLNDEGDIRYSDTIYEQYVKQIQDLEQKTVELKLKANVASPKDQANLKKEIKNLEETTHAMKIAMKGMNQFISSYKVGVGAAN